MATLFTARDIALLALRRVGVVAKQDSAAVEADIKIALQYLDTILAHKSGTRRLWFLVPEEITFTYTAGSNSVDLSAGIGTTKLQFVRDAYNDTTSDPIELLRRDQWDLYRNGLFPFLTDRALYIASDGDDTYTAYMLPVPTADVTVRLVGQKFSETLTSVSKSSSAAPHGFETAWQSWMEYALSCSIGDGPLARIPLDRLTEWRGIADQLWIELNSYRGGGIRNPRRFTRAWNG